MWALSIVLMMFGTLAVLTVLSTSPSTQYSQYKAQAIAQNFVEYRDAVIAYAENHPTHSGNVPLALIPLPPEWLPIQTWSNSMNAHLVLTWGTIPPDAVTEIETASQDTVAIGVTKMQAGKEIIYVPSTGGSITIPAGSIPIGAIASAVQIY